MTEEQNCEKEPSSFRDPSGFLFYRNGSIYRQINHVYRDDYELLTSSGLYDSLVESELLIPHLELGKDHGLTDECSVVIKPELVPFISYPYEWCFSQLKDAALTTLEIGHIVKPLFPAWYGGFL